MSSIIVDVSKFVEEVEIKEGAVNVFQNILSKPGDWRPSIISCLFLFGQ